MLRPYESLVVSLELVIGGNCHWLALPWAAQGRALQCCMYLTQLQAYYGAIILYVK